MKKKNGFTLVELLAVIVVLALIMIIAIPSVLKTMNDARKNSFVLFLEKAVKDVKTQYTSDSGLSGKISGPGYYIYDIATDLSYDSTGSYQGYVLIDASQDVDDPGYVITMWDGNYQIDKYIINGRDSSGYNVGKGYPTAKSSEIVKVDVNRFGSYNIANMCSEYLGGADDYDCRNKDGMIIDKSSAANVASGSGQTVDSTTTTE